jgi:hypothetical protein
MGNDAAMMENISGPIQIHSTTMLIHSPVIEIHSTSNEKDSTAMLNRSALIEIRSALIEIRSALIETRSAANEIRSALNENHSKMAEKRTFSVGAEITWLGLVTSSPTIFQLAGAGGGVGEAWAKYAANLSAIGFMPGAVLRLASTSFLTCSVYCMALPPTAMCVSLKSESS